MSHTVEVKVKFKKDQAPALQKAFLSLGWQWKENSTMKEYSGQGRKQFRYVAVNPNRSSYDVGFDIQNDELVPFTDLWGGSVEATLGKDFCKLKQEHSFNVIKDHYEAIGAMVSREVINGKQVVTVDDYS